MDDYQQLHLIKEAALGEIKIQNFSPLSFSISVGFDYTHSHEYAGERQVDTESHIFFFVDVWQAKVDCVDQFNRTILVLAGFLECSLLRIGQRGHCLAFFLGASYFVQSVSEIANMAFLPRGFGRDHGRFRSRRILSLRSLHFGWEKPNLVPICYCAMPLKGSPSCVRSVSLISRPVTV